MIPRKLVALGIDAPNHKLLAQWMNGGLLPNLEYFRRAGISGAFTHTKKYRNERCWQVFSQGQTSEHTGYHFDPASYDFRFLSLHEGAVRPFYALPPPLRVCTFDALGPIPRAGDGWHISGWGSELNSTPSVSYPPKLISDLIATFGHYPVTRDAFKVRNQTNGQWEESTALPNLNDANALRKLQCHLIAAVKTRGSICEYLLKAQLWDLFLGVFCEAHTANHLLWHCSEPYPVSTSINGGTHALLPVYQAIDEQIGRLVAQFKDSHHFLLFTLDETGPNTMDVPTMALLPELMYRWNCGEGLLVGEDTCKDHSAQTVHSQEHWKEYLWRLVSDRGQQLLESPLQQQRRGDPLSWNPANWYRPLWPTLRAFALPSASDGHIRLNVAGREAKGLVSPENFGVTVDNIVQMLERCTDPLSGQAAVANIIRTRQSAFERSEIEPDIIVSWTTTQPLNALAEKYIGQIGPLPFFRSGGHLNHGETIHNEFFALGPNLPKGQRMETGQLCDLPATILSLIAPALAARLPGNSLIPRGLNA